MGWRSGGGVGVCSSRAAKILLIVFGISEALRSVAIQNLSGARYTMLSAVAGIPGLYYLPTNR